MKLSGELDYRIRYDVEHDLFHAQNVFNDEYIKPTFIEYVQKLENENKLLGERCNQLLKDKGYLTDKIADIKANCDLAIEGRDIKIKELEQELTVQKDLLQEETNLHLHAEEYNKSLEQQIEKMKCCANCKSFKGYGETCEGWGEPVLNLNCDCTEWELRR